jgi:putative ABC transport system permease protein
VASLEHDLTSQRELVQALRDAYAANRIEPAWSWSTAEMREQQWEGFQTVVYLLLAVTVLAALVGSIGMMGTMSISVVERSREIGVMRATGADGVAIIRIFVGEGVLLGLLSWLLALPIAYPGGRLISGIVGRELLYLPLDYVYSLTGVLLWLALAGLVSALASLWPALRAAGVSVRQALAYE